MHLMKMVHRFVPAGLCVVVGFTLLLLIAPAVSSFQVAHNMIAHSQHGPTSMSTPTPPATCTTAQAAAQHPHSFSGGGVLCMSHSGSSEDGVNEANANASDSDESLVDEMIVMPTSRRSLLRQTATGTAAAAAAAVLASLSLVELAPPATAAVTTTSALSTTTATTTMDPSDAAVTHKAFMNVRISRQDGTFYVRDDLPDIPENKVFSGRLVIGLFGKNAPLAVERFLSYIGTTGSAGDDDNDDDVDNPKPSYSRSSFNSFDEGTGLLRGGKIASLEVTEIGGSTAIRYGGRLLPASLWIEGRGSGGSGGTSTKTATTLPPRVSHSAKGLLTHRILDVTPEFSITTRSDSAFLDGSSTVFGQLQIDDVSKDFLNIVKDLPTYRVDRAAQFMPTTPAKDTMPLDDAAQAIFNAQRAFFRKSAKSLGDTRIDKVFEGKLLRRVEVTQVGLM